MEQKALSVSVAMAVKDGLPYLEKQVQSILSQLADGDELIVSVDAGDTTSLPWLQAHPHPAMHLYESGKTGVLANFENAMAHCQNEIVFLADQDDVWTENKVKTVRAVFATQPKTVLVMHDARVVDSEENCLHPSFFDLRGVRHGVRKNWMKNSFMGCCMAFRCELLQVALPLPATIPMHDQWLGMLAEEVGGVEFLKIPLLLWRRHGANASATHHASFSKMLSFRLALLRAWRKRKKARKAFCKTYQK